MEGTYYIINGFINRQYSNTTIYKILNKLGVESGNASIYDIDESQIAYSLFKDYRGVIEDIEFGNMEELVSIVNGRFISGVCFDIEVGGRNIPVRLLSTIHTHNDYSVVLLMEYKMISGYMTNNLIELRSYDIRSIISKYFSIDDFLYGFCGEEILEVSLYDVLYNNGKFEDTDIYISPTLKKIIEEEMKCLPAKNIINIGGEKSDGCLVFIFEEIDTINKMSKTERDAYNKYKLWLRKIEDKIRSCMKKYQ